MARVSDIAACVALDASYGTDRTWQLAEERSPMPGAEELTIRLRTVRLPRPRSTVPPEPTADLEESWERGDLILVAEEGSIAGYAIARLLNGGVWVTHLVVDKPFRRTGIASGLLEAIREWAVESEMPHILAVVPAKNYPAVCLFMARAYRLCGFNERHYTNGEIALYLCQDIAIR